MKFSCVEIYTLSKRSSLLSEGVLSESLSTSTLLSFKLPPDLELILNCQHGTITLCTDYIPPNSSVAYRKHLLSQITASAEASDFTFIGHH